MERITMIRIKQLSKTYEKNGLTVNALKGIDLDIEIGDIYGIIGLSGAGKSTLVRCLNRLEQSTEGDIWIGHDNINALPLKALRQKRQKIGMIFQNFNLLSSMTVYENIAFPLKIASLSKDDIHNRVMYLLKRVGLEDKANVYPANLSGGQKQRVGIARALANEPDVLLCDEATSALDPKTTKQILELLRTLNQELGVTLIVITHEMEVIKSICNKVAILEDGLVIESGKTIDVFSRPSHAKTRHFLGDDDIPVTRSEKATRVRLTFSGKKATEPALSQWIRGHSLDVNIVSGNIESLPDGIIGKLVIDITGESNQIQSAIESLRKEGILVEVLHG